MTGTLLDISFWNVIVWLVIVMFWTLFLWMFIAIFADIFRRRDLSGFGKAGWILVICILPLLGILMYIVTRPHRVPGDDEAYIGGSGYSATEEIAKAQQLRQSGAITEEEFQQIKARALG